MKKILCIIAFLSINYVAKSQKVLHVGDTFTGFALKNVDDKIYNLNAQNVKGYILVFMTPTCDHCILYEERVEALNKKYKTRGFPVVAIGPYGDAGDKFPLDAMPEMKKLAKKMQFSFPYVSDSGFAYSLLMGIKTTPTAIVIQKRGASNYVIKYKGKIDDQPKPSLTPKNKYVEQVVDKLLKTS